MSDKIFLDQMSFYGYHGALPEERQLGQRFLVDLTLETGLYAAGSTDDLSRTINYADVFNQVQAIVEGDPCQLIETLAERIAAAVLHTFPLAEACRVKVIKPDPPIRGHYASVAVAIERRRVMAYLGLGSNIGDRASFLKQALEQLDNVPGVRVIRCSSIYETDPYGPVEQNDFLNLAVQIETIMPPLALLDTVQQIEKAMLRKREIHWGPRTIDLDILLYDQTIIHTERLALPHPEIARRAFVLKPMAEIAPHLVLPGINRSMIELWQTLEEKEGVRLWKTSNGVGKYGLFEN